MAIRRYVGTHPGASAQGPSMRVGTHPGASAARAVPRRYYFLFFIFYFLFSSCSTTRHVPPGQMLLREVDIDVEGDREYVDSDELYYFLRQTPNHKVLGFAKLQLATYNLSGRDSTQWFNRWVRRIGQPPVIYDQQLTDASVRQLHTALVNRGYMDATVTADTVVRPGGRKIDVTYRIATGTPHRIATLDYDIPDTAISAIVLADTAASKIPAGGPLDRNLLDAERTRITEQLRNHGYYAFTKEYISFLADTVAGSRDVGLTLRMRPPHAATERIDSVDTGRIRIASVTFLTDADAPASTPRDTVHYRDVAVVYGPDHYLRPAVLEEKCYIRPGQPYSARAVDRTYEALSQLGILRFINIEMQPAPVVDGEQWLDAVISLGRNRKQSTAPTARATWERASPSPISTATSATAPSSSPPSCAAPTRASAATSTASSTTATRRLPPRWGSPSPSLSFHSSPSVLR